MNQQRCNVTRVVAINSARFGHRFLYTSAHCSRLGIGTHATFAGVDARRARASRVIRVDSLAASLVPHRTRLHAAFACLCQSSGRRKRNGAGSREIVLYLFPSGIGNTSRMVPRTECPFAERGSPGDERVRFLYRRVDCRIGRGLQGRKRTERCWREGR